MVCNRIRFLIKTQIKLVNNSKNRTSLKTIFFKMIFDVSNLCNKIGVTYMLFELAPLGNSSVNNGCPNQKVIALGSWAT